MQVVHNRGIRRATFALCLVLAPFSSILNAWQLKFQHIGAEEGLSQDIVTSIVQDSLGFMWFGTEDGLNRYDGYGMTVFKNNPRDTNSLSSNAIGALMVDAGGRLWVATTNGTSVMESGTSKFNRINLPPNEVERMAEPCVGPDSTVWILTGSGLYRHSHEGKTSLVSAGAENISPGRVLLFDQRKRKLIVGTSAGLMVFSASGDTLIPEPIGLLRDHKVSALCRSSSGDIFVGTLDAGLFRLNSGLETVEQYRFRESDQGTLSDNRVLSLAEDHQQRLWVGTFSGLDMLDRASGTFTRYRDENDISGLRGDRVYSIFVDRSGVLWVGTYRGGINRFDPHRQRFAHVAYEPHKVGGLHARDVYSLLETDDGDLWVGTNNGLFRRANGTLPFRQYNHDPLRQGSLSSDGIFALCQRRNGELWIGCADGVVNRYVKAQDGFVRYPFPKGNPIRSIYETRDGRLLVGTDSKGAFVLDSIEHRFVPWEGLGDSTHPAGVWTMYQDRPGFLWLGTFYIPYIVRIDPGTQIAVKIYADAQREGALTIASVRSFCESVNGTLYLGTWAGGFARFDRQSDSFTWYTEVDGLPSNYVKAILPDARGRIWIATEHGLARFDPKTASFRTYTVEDGLQSNFFWSGSGCRGKDGKLYFGGTNGFNEFHPDSISENMNIPPVVITSVRVLDKPVPIPAGGDDRTIELTYEADFFSFEFVALDYTFPGRNQYAYMLEGFDRDWVKSGTRRYAAYTHLDPGRYVFRVRGSNNDGIWNETGTALAIVIAPPYWMTWWFRSLAVLVLAAALYGVYRYRMSRLLEIEQMRGRIAADLHDDVGSELGHIALASQLLARKVSLPEREQHQLFSIGASALHASEMMREVVWFMNPTNDSLRNVILKMRSLADAQLNGLDVAFDAPLEDLSDGMDPEVKRNIVLMYKEILHNIAKHARATKVSVRVQVHSHRLQITISDNGVGFEPAAPFHGNGLKNLRSRATHIRGDLSIASAAGKGTTVDLAVKF